MRLRSFGLVAVVIADLVGLPAFADDDIAQQGFALVKKYCYDCHGVRTNGNPLFNVLDPAGLIEREYVLPDAPVEDSFMWQRISSGEMPLEDSPQPTAEEKDIMKRWIAAGVPIPKASGRRRVQTSEADVVKMILEDLRGFNAGDAQFKRYFTLHHLANNPSVNDFDLRLYRAALSKAINSLTFADKIILPIAIDEAETVFRIDLRKLRWDQNGVWSKLLVEYPYGLRYGSIANDDQFQRHAEQLANASNADLAYIRGDWFAITATRGELYDSFLDIPATALELETRLGVDVQENFLASPARLHRAGFDESGVSSGARVVERHALPNRGYYWKSYDFVPGNLRSVLSRFPLGPIFEGNVFGDRFGFQPNGGEIIFSLPNGMQGYMLVGDSGGKIHEGPIKVVRDLNETSGTPEVVNAISCMQCHRHGMIRFEDSVRLSLGLGGEPRNKARELYSTAEKMRTLVEQDSQRFLTALAEATGPFLQVADDKDKLIGQFAEPIGAVARLYQRDLSLQDAATELGISSDKLKQAIDLMDELRFLGLGPLAQARKINRAAWENKDSHVSPFQNVARELKIGTPLTIFQ